MPPANAPQMTPPLPAAVFFSTGGSSPNPTARALIWQKGSLCCGWLVASKQFISNFTFDESFKQIGISPVRRFDERSTNRNLLLHDVLFKSIPVNLFPEMFRYWMDGRFRTTGAGNGPTNRLEEMSKWWSK